MGVARLDDAEFARRARERNARVNAAHRQRLLEAGKAQTNVWLSAELRERLDDEAAADGVSLSVVVERLLSAALNPATDASESDTDAADSPPVDSAPTLGERDRRILALHESGLSNYKIAAQVGCSEPTIRRVLKRAKEI